MPTDSPQPRILFERRQYDAIAAVIRELGCVTEFQRQSLATEFGLRISQTNPRFDRARFVAACLPQVPDVPQVPQVPQVPAIPPTPDTCQFLACAHPVVAWCDRSGVGGGAIRYYCDRHRSRNPNSCCRPIDSTTPLARR